jgi:hypothetical protein
MTHTAVYVYPVDVTFVFEVSREIKPKIVTVSVA